MVQTKGAKAAHTCAECGKALVLRNYTHTEKVGRYRVTDATSQLLQCSGCGEPVLTSRDWAGYQRRAAAVVLREARTVDGAVMRYARKAIGLRQVDLAGLLGYAPETLSRWETGDLPIPRTAELALVAVLDGVELCGGDVDAFVECEKGGRPASHTLEVPQTRRIA